MFSASPQGTATVRSPSRRLSQAFQLDDEHLVKLIELDLQLKQRTDLTCKAEHLHQLRQSLQPPEPAWWWHLEAPVEVQLASAVGTPFRSI